MGEGLDKELQEFVSVSESFSTPGTSDLKDIRASYNLMCQHYNTPHPEGLKVLEGAVEGPEGDIPIRVYRPVEAINETAPNAAKKHPTLLYFHGGGWVLGDLDSHDAITADLASQAKVQVIAVDYRLAPEHVYPAALDDCWAVYQAITESPEIFGANSDRLIIGGDSAGASLAASVALIARDINLLGFNAPSLKGQLLIYPALTSENLPSRTTQAQAPLFSTPDLDNFIDYYLGHKATEEDKQDFKIFPAQAGDFSKLPTAFISAAELDPLADDGPDYADKLKATGVQVKSLVEPGLMHGWLRARHSSPRAAEAFARIVQALRNLSA
ncbi:alpha/beta hydrolase [Kiloniella majae]|uniref:alpha/beta hydrolase n=1 Tax=Kiloniella majae TaxID=1938558 RepID=UPI000A277DBF|nr:alpha/beta hydrolase [Kiloniella majae]